MREFLMISAVLFVKEPLALSEVDLSHETEALFLHEIAILKGLAAVPNCASVRPGEVFGS